MDEWLHLARRALGALAVCLAYYFLARNFLGDLVWVFLALVIGIAFNRIVIDVLALLGWHLKSAALRSLQGQHYEFQGHPFTVLEDESHFRWVAVKALRAVVGTLATDQALVALYPAGHLFAQPGGKALHLRDDAVLDLLQTATEPRTLHFRRWLERSVSVPARKTRERFGVRTDDPRAPPPQRSDAET